MARSMLFGYQDDGGYFVEVTGDDQTGDVRVAVYAPGTVNTTRVTDVPLDQVESLTLALAAHLHRTRSPE